MTEWLELGTKGCRRPGESHRYPRLSRTEPGELIPLSGRIVRVEP